MEIIKFNEEECMLKYLYQISTFKEYINNSYENFIILNKDIPIHSDLLENNFGIKNSGNENHLSTQRTLLSLYPNEDLSINDKSKEKIIRKIKTILGIDLNSKIAIEDIFEIVYDNFSRLNDVINQPVFIKLMAEKLKVYLLESNYFYFLIIKMLGQKLSELVIESKKENEKITTENKLLNNENLSLKEIIEKNNKIIESLKATIKEAEIKSKNLEIMELKMKDIEKIAQAKIKNLQQIIEDNKKAEELKIKNMKKIIDEEAQAKIKTMQQIIDDNKKEAQAKIKELEDKIETNKNDADKKYNYLSDKYFKLFSTHLKNIIICEERQKMFNSYADKIKEINDKNNCLENMNEKLKIELDMKNIEIKDLKNEMNII